MSEPISLPFNQWPEPDKTMWLAVVAGSDGWLDYGLTVRWNRRTRAEARLSYGRWLQWLLHNDKLDRATAPATRVTSDLVSAFVNDELRRIKSCSVANILFHLVGVLTNTAPQQDWRWLYTIRHHIKRLARQQPQTIRRIVAAQCLYELGLNLMHRAMVRQSEGLIDVETYLDGLLIALLISEIQRISAFAALELDRHVQRGPSRWHVNVDAKMTKTKQAEHGLLPASLTQYIDFYVDSLRPRLVPVSNQAAPLKFWLGRNGMPLSANQIRERIKFETRKAFGFAICPHTFRHIAETSFILDRPELALYGPALLGHRSKETTERYYFIAQQQLALKTYHDILNGQAPKKHDINSNTHSEHQANMLILSASPT